MIAPSSDSSLAQVTGPNFCAGLVLENGIVVEAAPILAWTIGKDRWWIERYFRMKRGHDIRTVPLLGS